MEKISKTLLKNYLIEQKGLSILECGAYDGSETKEFREDHNCWYLEPDKTLYENIKSETDNSLNIALSFCDGEAEFSIANIAGNSSIEHSSKHLKDIKITGSTKVKTISYKSLLNKLFIKKFNILVLDVEGHEEKILKDIFSNLDIQLFPEILCVECGYDWGKRQEIILDAGYIQDFYSYNNCFFSMGNLIKLNTEEAKKTNLNNPRFVFGSSLIYENDCKTN